MNNEKGQPPPYQGYAEQPSGYPELPTEYREPPPGYTEQPPVYQTNPGGYQQQHPGYQQRPMGHPQQQQWGPPPRGQHPVYYQQQTGVSGGIDRFFNKTESFLNNVGSNFEQTFMSGNSGQRAPQPGYYQQGAPRPGHYQQGAPRQGPPTSQTGPYGGLPPKPNAPPYQ